MPSVEERLRYWRTRAQRMQVALEDISTDTVQGPLDDELGLIMRMQDVAKEVLGDDPSEFDQIRAKIERLTKALEAAAEELDRIFCVPPVTETSNLRDQFDLVIAYANRGAIAANAALSASTSREGER